MRAAVIGGTRSIYHRITPAIKALLKHSDVERVYLLIEDDEFPEPLPEKVRAINVSGQPWFQKGGPNFNRMWSYMVLLRVAYPKMFPQLDRVLSIDVDAFCVDDISELWRINLDGYYIAAVPEPQKSRPGYPYVNCGVMMMNLEAMRKDGMDDRLIGLLNRKPYEFAEQDCINEQIPRKLLLLDGRYNHSNYTAAPTKPVKVIHFAAIPKWWNAELVKQYAEMPWPE